jgi:hypothetical protein
VCLSLFSVINPIVVEIDDFLLVCSNHMTDTVMIVSPAANVGLSNFVWFASALAGCFCHASYLRLHVNPPHISDDDDDCAVTVARRFR